MLRKSINKRIRVTKNGKVVRRPMATDHGRTRQTGKTNRQKRQGRGLSIAMKQIVH